MDSEMQDTLIFAVFAADFVVTTAWRYYFW
ncbi:hypothetical protein A1E_05465 [Rickettsia canadensis str. McKiel]|uniref:Uncharacterized protein n=1 Tax=Rickettsia canadensis (strain McKiel) TaxID=293613 RepID=A8F074_RICCK|nr:hypothetical protein A1E_05465 [Rickettsia canadensis str. McKiel]